MDYKKAEPKRDPVWDYKNNPELEGVYKSFDENVGPNDSMLYHIEQLDGSMISVWGSTVLDSRMLVIPIGTQIKIQYLGDVKNPKGGKPYHNFEVWMDKDVEPKEEEPPLPED